MPSSYTANLRLEQQFTGENVNTWGVRLNNAIARLDDSVAGYTAIAITGAYTVQSANDNATADEARRAHLKFTGTLATNATITLPSVSKSYWIWNATNKTLTFTLGAGTTATVESGDILPLWADGTNVKSVMFGAYNLKDYIAQAALSASGSLPATAGNAGKYLFTDGTTSFWQQPSTSDLTDYSTSVLGVQIAFSIAL